MAKGKKNSISLKAIGKAIKSKRDEEIIDIAEVRNSIGVPYSTVTQIENGEDIYLSNFLKICFALDLHPKDLLDIEFDVILTENTANQSEKSKITGRIRKLIKNNYFQDWRSTGDVVEALNKDHPVEVKSNNVSSILSQFHDKGKLQKRNKKNSSRLKEYKKA